MLSSRLSGRLTFLGNAVGNSQAVPVRHASLTSAISRGVRQTGRALERAEDRKVQKDFPQDGYRPKDRGFPEDGRQGRERDRGFRETDREFQLKDRGTRELGKGSRDYDRGFGYSDRGFRENGGDSRGNGRGLQVHNKRSRDNDRGSWDNGSGFQENNRDSRVKERKFGQNERGFRGSDRTFREDDRPRRTFDRDTSRKPLSSSRPSDSPKTTSSRFAPTDRDLGALPARRSESHPKMSSQGGSVDAPSSIPYTTAASEFLYGTFAVLAALKARRRRFHKLYIWTGSEGSVTTDENHAAIVRAAKAMSIPIKRVAGIWDRILEKMSGGRPHNGFVLEASSIPKIPALALSALENSDSGVSATLGYVNEEDKALLRMPITASGTTLVSPKSSHTKRQPFLLWLDRITDTGNMGAIMRTAHFFGVDAIIVPDHGTAPITAVTVKSSAGAAEYMPILTVKYEVDFMQRSQENGWLFFAAVAADSLSTVRKLSAPSGASTKQKQPTHQESISTSDEQPRSAYEALRQSPCVLMLGNEGEGLRPFLQRKANRLVSIDGPKPSLKNSSTNGQRGHHYSSRTENTVATKDTIDSLNVSVAAAILMDRFLTNPENVVKSSHHNADRVSDKTNPATEIKPEDAEVDNANTETESETEKEKDRVDALF